MAVSTDISGIKHFLTRMAVGAVPLVLFILTTVYFWFCIRPNLRGDLGELGKIQFDPGYSDSILAPVLPDCMVCDYIPGKPLTGVLTIGDSFSQQKHNGYQNFLAHRLGERVTNYVLCPAEGDTPEQSAVDMLNSGFFDDCPGIEYVVIETVEREFVDRLNNLDFNRRADRLPGEASSSGGGTRSDDGLGVFRRMIRQGIDWIKLSLGLETSPVCVVDLTKECFTVPDGESRLYFYKDDLACLSATDDELSAAASNLKVLHSMFAGKGIKMIFMLAPDKYELYQHLAVGGVYPRRMLGRQLSALDTLGFVVNPLPELTRSLDMGEKDLYMANDTHWSSRGAEIAAGVLYGRIRPCNDCVESARR